MRGTLESPPSSRDEPSAAIERLRDAVARGETPGFVVSAGRGDEVAFTAAGGVTELGARGRPITPGTRFDLASVTKVVATLPVVLRLVAGGQLALDTRVAELIPDFTGAPGKDAVTVRQLLTHTSGLPATREYWREGLTGESLLTRLLGEPLQSRPGTRVVYSDLGFLALGRLAEIVGGAPLPALFAAHVGAPLAMAGTGFGPLAGRDDVAATEPRPDGTPVRGTVHDETAAALGGVAGHAGLFGTAADLGRYLAAWADPGETWLALALRRLATENLTPDLDGCRGLGWVARGDAFDQLGERWPGSAVFHSGFTGTSLALDPVSRRWVVLLTHDVHLGRGRGLINPLRRVVHTALAP